KMHTFILRIYICGIQLQEQRYHISGIAVPVYWNSGAILAGIFTFIINPLECNYAYLGAAVNSWTLRCWIIL
ncbi:hypothetical protein, partial [Mogibacterium kristiansenii]|uniref:hypothetical protein n=1 Tax=Mogibacterium kristiansenii TaxID=2606708 RepID=UPI00197FD959